MTGDDVRSVTFRERLRGYHQDDVDEALEKIAARLDRGELRPTDLEGLHFRMKLRGYDQGDVDRVIERLRASIA